MLHFPPQSAKNPHRKCTRKSLRRSNRLSVLGPPESLVLVWISLSTLAV